MSRARDILNTLLEQTNGGTGNGGANGSSGGTGAGDSGGSGGSDTGDSDGAESNGEGKKKKPRLGIRSRFSYTAFNKCNCDKPDSEMSAYCRKYCNKGKK